jgi:ribosomal protein S18 acetylase RimI-like enzyme
VLTFLPALTAESRAGVRDLEGRVVAADGGRLKLEWGILAAHEADGVRDPRVGFWTEDGRVLGFVGIYAFGGGSTAELAGMVDPAARRRGIGSALLDGALRLCRERPFDQVLLVTPRNAAGGREFALARGGRLDHSEHALVLRRAPTPGPSDPAVTLRRAGPDDAAVVGRLLRDAFDWEPDNLRSLLGNPEERTMLALLDGSPVGTLRLTSGPGWGAIHGFGVDPAWQGRGIGRDVLRRSCALLRAEGADTVGLEVAVDNERALGLYLSVGFEPVLTEDYYALY